MRGILPQINKQAAARDASRSVTTHGPTTDIQLLRLYHVGLFHLTMPLPVASKTQEITFFDLGDNSLPREKRNHPTNRHDLGRWITMMPMKAFRGTTSLARAALHKRTVAYSPPLVHTAMGINLRLPRFSLLMTEAADTSLMMAFEPISEFSGSLAFNWMATTAEA